LKSWTTRQQKGQNIKSGMSDRLNDNLKITVYIFKFQINKKSASILNPVTLMGGIDYESARVILTGIQSGKANSISQNQLN